MRIGRTLQSKLIVIALLMLCVETGISAVQFVQFRALNESTLLLQTQYEVVSDDTARLREEVIRVIARVQTLWVRDKQIESLDLLTDSADQSWETIRVLRTKIETDIVLDDAMRQQLQEYDRSLALYYLAYQDALAGFRQDIQGPDPLRAGPRADAKTRGKGLAASIALGTFEDLVNARTKQIRVQQRNDINQTNNFLLRARIVRVLIIIAIGFWLMRDVVQGVQRISDAAFALGRGKRDVVLPVRGRDEIAQLSSAFNTMVSELNAQEQRLEELRRIAIALTGATEEYDVCDVVVSRLAETFGYTYVSIYLIRPNDPYNLHLVVQHGYETVIDPIPVLTTVTGRCVLEQKPILVSDGNDDPDFIQAEQQITCEAVAPIIAQGRVIGTLLLEEDTAGALTDDDLRLIVTLANNVGAALENVRLNAEAYGRIAELASTNRDLDAVTKTGTRLAAILDPEAAVEFVAAELDRVVNAPDLYISLCDEKTDSVVMKVAKTDNVRVSNPPPMIPASSLGVWLIHHGRLIAFSSRAEVEAFVAAEGLVLRSRISASLIGVPLAVGDRIIGAFTLSSPEPGAFTTQQLSVVQTIAAQAAISIRNAQLYREVREHAQEMDRLNTELARANELKSEFLATMSHELRTPLNAVIGFSELLADGIVNDPEAINACLNDILNSGRHLLSLINDILDISKIEAGKMEIKRETFDMRGEIVEAGRLVASLTATRHQHLTLDAPESPAWVSADRQRVRQILLNLLSNAIKFTPDHGTITVRCAFDVSTTNSPFVQVDVCDTGIGIKPEDHHIIFQKFRQVDSSFARKYEGTGLGLALTKQLVELNGGEISFRSTYGAGSTFTFTVPQAHSPVRVSGAVPAVVLLPQ